MITNVDCHKCNKEFEAEENVKGKCPYCNTKYDWYWDEELWSEIETCCVIFDSESEKVKKHF